MNPIFSRDAFPRQDFQRLASEPHARRFAYSRICVISPNYHIMNHVMVALASLGLGLGFWFALALALYPQHLLPQLYPQARL